MGRFLLLFSFLISFLNIPNVAAEKDSSDVLSAFTARIKDKTIQINWRITNPKYIAYFDIQKHDSKTRLFQTINKDARIKLSDYIEQGADDYGLAVYKFNYEDDPEKDGVYYYRIKASDAGGKQLFISDEIKIGVNGLRDFILEQNHPNPFNPSTTIKYSLSSQTHVTLKIFDLIGRVITTLVDQTQNEGDYTVDFDASKYPDMTSGIYFYKLETDKYTEVKKMILAK